MIVPFLISALVAAADPAPAATAAPPEIIHTVTSEQCSTLHKMTLPVGYVAKVNDQAFGAMALSTSKFLKHFMPGDAPTAADIQSALGNTPDNNQNSSIQESGIGQNQTANNGTGTALTASESSGREDDPILYGPGQTLNAARIDAVAQQIYGNIELERKYMNESIKEYPPGTDARVDQLRERAQNLIDLQQALADRYDQFAFTYLSNIGAAQMQTNDQASLGVFKTSLRGLILGDVGGLGGGAPLSGADQNFGYDSVQQLARTGSNGQIVAALRYHQYQFTQSLFDTYNVCHGTHFTIAPPRPAPTETP